MAVARQCGVPPAANYPMYAGLLSALDADNPEPLLNQLMLFGFVRETMAEPLTWTCGRCTLLNSLRNERCEACEFARGHFPD